MIQPMTETLLRYTLLALAALLSTPSIAAAEPTPIVRAGSVEIAPMVGYEWFGQTENIENDAWLGLRTGFNVTSMLGVELSLGHTQAETTEAYGGTECGAEPTCAHDIGVTNLALDLVVRLADARVMPYLHGGVGLKFNKEPEFPGGESRDLDPVLGYGAGLKIWLTDWASLRLDARHKLAFDRAPYKLATDQDGEEAGFHPDNWFNNFILSAGLSFQLGGTPGDSDDDGVDDDADKCPDDPEDVDGWQDEDGCPDLDDDNDGIPDATDKCRREPEDIDNHLDEDGCPDEDNDGDGVLDVLDKCPDEAEDKDGWQDEDGCPDDDNDGDGIPDPVDKCPGEAEDKDGWEDEDGCPDDDNDGDGIPDSKDADPMRPETFNGYLDDDGAPDEVPEKLKEFTGTIAGINFETASAKLTRDSIPKLTRAAATLGEFPELKLEVQGHTDSRGDDAYNRKLSQERANSVLEFLVGAGITPERIRAIGFGRDKPIDPAGTSEAWSKNRRVEFQVKK